MAETGREGLAETARAALGMFADTVRLTRDDLAFHRALHVRHFLRALVDQQHDQVALGVVGGDRLGDVLQEHRLTGAGRGDDQRALALSDRRDDVDDP